MDCGKREEIGEWNGSNNGEFHMTSLTGMCGEREDPIHFECYFNRVPLVESVCIPNTVHEEEKYSHSPGMTPNSTLFSIPESENMGKHTEMQHIP